MYLEAIFMLSKKLASVRSIDICDYLGYSKPSVSRAVKILREGGFIEVAKNGELTLTDKGRGVAASMYERHTILTNLLTSLGVTPEVADHDACKIEHDLSKESYEAIKKHFLEYVK
jgi:Mn-dependent DtxR family transcriptional regulator